MILIAASARAELRSDAVADLPSVIPGVHEKVSIAAMGNPAGFGTVDRRNELDIVLGVGVNAESESDGSRSASRAEGVARLAGPGGAWEGLTLFPGEKDAVRIAVPVEGGFAFASVTDGGANQAGVGHLAVDVGVDLTWARRVAPGFALGARLNPARGRFLFPAGAGIAADRGSYTLLDYSVGAAFVIPGAAGVRREVGVTYAPFDDRPDPMNVLGAFGVSALGSGGLGGYTIDRRIEFAGGASQTFRISPTGTILGAQGVWAREGGWELGLGADVTAAQTDQLTRTDLNLPGVPVVEQSGLSFTLSRIRYALEARVPFARRDGRLWRLGATLAGARGSVDQYDFPVSHDVILAQNARRVMFTCAVAREREGAWLLGAGFDAGADRTVLRDPAAGGAVTGTQRVGAGTVRLGAERHLGARWAVRGGVAVRTESSNDSDPATPPPGTPDNPRRGETSLTLGGGWQGTRTTWDLVLALRPRSQDPAPVPPRAWSGAKVEAKLGFSRWW